MITVGSVVVKIAGRDAGKAGVVVKREGSRILIDGEVRRREVSLDHVEPLSDVVELAEGASTADVRTAMEAIGFEFPEERKDKREHKPGPRPRKQRGTKPDASKKKTSKKPAKAEKAPKSESKKVEKSAKTDKASDDSK